jgi:hypothetical protein
LEVYSSIALTSYSGIDALYTIDLGKSSVTFQPYLGSLPLTSTLGFELEVDMGLGLNTSFQFDYGSIRAQAMTLNNGRGSDDSGALDFEFDGQVFSLGVDIEVANVVLISEYMKKTFEYTGIPGYSEVVGDAWYVTLGYRVGKFLPHITYASADSDKDQAPALDVFIADLLTDPVFAGFVGTLSPTEQAALIADPIAVLSDPSVLAALSGAGVDLSSLSSLASAANVLLPPAPLSYKQTSIAVGVRYDFLPRTALKLEYQEIEPQEESWGLFVQEPAADKVSLVSFAIDVTF